MLYRSSRIALLGLLYSMKQTAGFLTFFHNFRFKSALIQGRFFYGVPLFQPSNIMSMAKKKKDLFLENNNATGMDLFYGTGSTFNGASQASFNGASASYGTSFNGASQASLNIKIKPNAPIYKPKNENQKQYVQSLVDPATKIVINVGPAGCGKTLFAVYNAILELKKGTIQKLVMTRPLVSVDKEDMGFLPGDIVSKMDPWTRPVFDILLEFFAQRDIDHMIKEGIIEISPLAYMRGRTFKNCWIIADEMQNSSPNQMLMMTTRIGLGTKMIITGDLKQSDRGQDNGLHDLIQKLKSYNGSLEEGIKLIEMQGSDVERSPIVSKILDIYGGSTLGSNKGEYVPVSTCNSTVSKTQLGDCSKNNSYMRTLFPEKNFDIDMRPTNKW